MKTFCVLVIFHRKSPEQMFSYLPRKFCPMNFKRFFPNSLDNVFCEIWKPSVSWWFSPEKSPEQKGFHISQKTLSNEFEKKDVWNSWDKFSWKIWKHSVLEILMENHHNTKGFHISQKTPSKISRTNVFISSKKILSHEFQTVFSKFIGQRFLWNMKTFCVLVIFSWKITRTDVSISSKKIWSNEFQKPQVDRINNKTEFSSSMSGLMSYKNFMKNPQGFEWIFCSSIVYFVLHGFFCITTRLPGWSSGAIAAYLGHQCWQLGAFWEPSKGKNCSGTNCHQVFASRTAASPVFASCPSRTSTGEGSASCPSCTSTAQGCASCRPCKGWVSASSSKGCSTAWTAWKELAWAPRHQDAPARNESWCHDDDFSFVGPRMVFDHSVSWKVKFLPTTLHAGIDVIRRNNFHLKLFFMLHPCVKFGLRQIKFHLYKIVPSQKDRIKSFVFNLFFGDATVLLGMLRVARLQEKKQEEAEHVALQKAASETSLGCLPAFFFSLQCCFSIFAAF